MERKMKFFTKAIVRQPAKSFINAIAQDPHHIKPNYDKTIAEYEQYIKTLENMGLQITICDPNENFPDGNFVEDTHLILSDKMIIELNPGAPSRMGEPMSLAPHLPKDIPKQTLSKQFTIDGGDILKDGKTLYIGLSTRTQQEAIDELSQLVSPLGYHVYPIKIPQGLHLKSGMTRILPNHFVIQASFEAILKQIQLINNQINYFVVPREEYFAANVLPINGKIMIPMNCPKTKQYISQYYPVQDIYEVDTEQVRRVDGALTCSSLLLR
jgi:dimethylargininase